LSGGSFIGAGTRLSWDTDETDLDRERALQRPGITYADRWHGAREARCLVAALAPAYRPRRPTETVLYAVARDHLETFLAHARDTYSAPLPRYVEEELRGYLRCGVFAHGFVLCRCDECGHDLLVAFSCKARAVCPSCAGRRMANVAAHLVENVLS